MTQFPDLFAALAAPFDPEEVKVRNQAGRQLHYVTARTVMNRLDSVLGPENWWDEYAPGENSVVCKLTIRLPDGSTLTKSDAGGYAGMADSGDDDKSGFSDSYKRAAVKFGVGRYLYRDGVPSFGLERADKFVADAADLVVTKAADVPARPANGKHQANGKGTGKPRDVWGSAYRGDTHGTNGGTAVANPNPNPAEPKTGKQLFAWCRDQEQRHQVGMVKYLNAWAKLQEFPGRMVDWDARQVSLGYAEAVRKLGALHDGEEGGDS